MLGAIIGDYAGSRFEWKNIKTKEFEMFHHKCRFTDDTAMTLAVAKAIMDSSMPSKKIDISILGENAVRRMQEMGRYYPEAGYGKKFKKWIFAEHPEPYNSLGNGAAMRVSPCGEFAASLEEAEAYAEVVTAVTHNHPEGIKAAKAVAGAILLAKANAPKDAIRRYIESYYNIDFTLDEIRADYSFDVTCQGSVPQALEAFFESDSFEDAIRNAISIGGDSDTIAAITGGIAEAYYGVPEWMVTKIMRSMNRYQRKIVMDWYGMNKEDACDEMPDSDSEINSAIKSFYDANDKNALLALLKTIKENCVWIPCTAVLSETDQQKIHELVKAKEDDIQNLVGMTLQNNDIIRLVPDILQKGEQLFMPAFAKPEDMGEYGNHFSKVEMPVSEAITMAKNNDHQLDGIVINPFGAAFQIENWMFDMLK